MRSPGAPCGLATNRSAVRPGRATYPRASCTPARYSSPTTPVGTGRRLSSRTSSSLSSATVPIGTVTVSAAVTSCAVTSTVASVGP
ncbi:Uncharacterised protein [Mycobacteroides abscessus subsp. abscessus]|nr:Uncharacterised protein [Mycobacteroides abscessus subsp. abscessus]